MYSFESRIRYSETGSDSKLTILSLLNYFQDCAIFHSEDLDIGVEYLRKYHGVWVMNFWQIDIDRYPALGDKVEIQTHPYDFKLCLGSRNFAMLDEKGMRLAVANSLWTYLNTENGHPAKPEKAMLDKYGVEPPDEMEYLERKIVTEGKGKAMSPVPVAAHHLDTNFHVNNAQYVAIACDYLPEGFRVARLRASYHKSAVLNDVLYPVLYLQTKETVVVSVCDENGAPYAIVEFCNCK